MSNLVHILFYLISLPLFSVSTADESCQSSCSTHGSPRCGVWIHANTNRPANGVYLLEDSLANLTCIVASSPRPATIRWFFESEFTTDRTVLACSSLRTITECKYNEQDEHRVTSACLVKMTRLEQTGSYLCSANLEGYPEAESDKVRIHIYGISNLTIYEQSEIYTKLEYGRIGRIRIRICANPKPHVVWIHGPSGRTLPAGSALENVTASVLYHDYDTSNAAGTAFGPIQHRHYCYLSSLIIGKVDNQSDQWTVMAWNSADSKRLDVPIRLVGVPILPSSAFQINSSVISIIGAIVIGKCLNFLI